MTTKLRIKANPPAPLLPPAATSKLYAYCSRCQSEVRAAALNADGLCGACITVDAVAPFKVEYSRLWAKRMRYLKAGLNCGPVEHQLAKVAKRFGDQVHMRVANPMIAIQIINAELADARDKVEHGNSRIILPKSGDMLARHQGVGRELRQLVGA